MAINLRNNLLLIAILNHLWLRLRSAISPRWLSEVEACFNSFRIAYVTTSETKAANQYLALLAVGINQNYP